MSTDPDVYGEVLTFVKGTFVQQYIQIAICTLLVYDTGKYR